MAAGSSNNTNNQCNAFILGSNITASQPNYTYVNNLSSQGNVNALNICSSNSINMGRGNIVTGNNSVALGICNTVTGNCSTVSGQYNIIPSSNSAIFGGIYNCTCNSSGGSVIIGGYSNTNSGLYTTIVGGRNNIAVGNCSIIAGGYGNYGSGILNIIGAGCCNCIATGASCSFIAAGSYNYIPAGANNTYLLGSSLSASQPNYTYVNNLSSQNAICGSYIYGNGSNLTNLNLPSTATFSNSVSSPSISAVNFFGTGNQVILSDGYTNNNASGNGASTLSMNFANGVYVGLSGSNPIYALSVPQYYTLQSTASSINSGMPYFYNGFPQADYLTSGAQYEIEYILYYQKNTAGTVTYQLSSSNTIGFISSNYIQTAVAGITPNGATSNAASLYAFGNSVNLPATGSLTAATSANAIIKTYVQTSSTPTNFILNIISSAGTITPLQGSYRKVTRIS